jgi:paraquat-inducible protein B
MIISSTNRGNDNDFQPTIGHDIVAESTEVKDLGIITGNDITFTSHVNSVLAKVSVRANVKFTSVLHHETLLLCLKPTRYMSGQYWSMLPGSGHRLTKQQFVAQNLCSVN